MSRARTVGSISAVAALMGLGALAVVGSTAAANHAPADSDPAGVLTGTDSQAGHVVTVDTTEMSLVCPGGILDPTVAGSEPGESWQWVSSTADVTALAGGGYVIDPGVLEAAQDFPSGLSLAASYTGQDRSLLMDSCQVPTNQLGFSFGSTLVGADSMLTVSNPNSTPVTVVLTGFDQRGLIGVAEQILTVAAESTSVWRPAVWFPDVERLGLTITADGAGVAAWLQVSEFTGEVPLGLGRFNATAPSRTNVFPLVTDAGTDPVLTLLNPTDGTVTVDLQVITAEGATTIPGTENLQMSPGAVFHLNVGNLGPETFALAVNAGEPLVADLAYRLEGTPSEVAPEQNVAALSIISPTVPTLQVNVPPLAQIRRQLVEAGLTDVKFELALVNLEGLDVNLGDLQVPARGQLLLDQDAVADLEGGLSADLPLYATLQVRASTPTGPVLAATGLTGATADQIVRKVVIEP